MSDEFETRVTDSLARIETKLDVEMKNVCDDIAENKTAHENLRGKVEAQGRDIARLQVKASMWGAVSGIITGALAALGLRA